MQKPAEQFHEPIQLVCLSYGSKNVSSLARAKVNRRSVCSRLALALIGFVIPAAAFGGLFGPSNYEECILEGMKGVASDQAARAVMAACRKKFPEPPGPKYEPPRYAGFSILNSYSPAVDAMVTSIDVRKLRIVRTDYGGYLALDVTNRNDFEIAAVQVALLKKRGQCSRSDADYAEMYGCEGRAPARSSATFACYIPEVVSRKVEVCLTGFAIYGTQTEINAFKARHSIKD